MSRIRAALLLLGVLAAAYGVLRMLDLGWANTRATLFWLVGGVVLHDAVLASVILVVSLVAVRLVPRERLAPWVVALVVLVPVTLLAIPELGRFGARADRPTLLDRNYWLGWSGLVTLVVASVLAGALLRARRRTPAHDGTGGDDVTSDGGR
jgi:hypothetical protein